MVTMGEVNDAPNALSRHVERFKVGLDASDCGMFYRCAIDINTIHNTIPILMAGDSVIDPVVPGLVRLHASPPVAEGKVGMAGRLRMGLTYHDDFPPEIADGIVALSPDGSLLLCVKCMLVGDDESPAVYLQRKSWEHCPPERKRLELYHYEPYRGAEFGKANVGCFVMDLLEFPEGVHEEFWSLDAANIAWKPCCPPGRQIYAVMTAKWDLVLVAAFDQLAPLKTWSLEELVSMGLNDCFKAHEDEPAVSLSWSADGSHLLCSTDVEPCRDEDISSCVIISFS